MPFVLGHARDTQEDEVARAVREALGFAEVEARDPRAQDACLHDLGAPGAPRDADDPLDRESGDRDRHPLPEHRAVEQSDREPHDVERVRRMKDLELPTSSRRGPREEPHDAEDDEPNDAGAPGSGR
jgi:hypothetical protein